MSPAPRPSGRLSQSPRAGGWAPNLTPKAAVRIAALGGFILAMLGLLLVRLWFLQVISSEDYAALAQSNHLRTVVVEAPRGNILAADGSVLVGNSPAKNIVASPSELRDERVRDRVLTRLSRRLALVRGEAVPVADLQERLATAIDQGQPTAVLVENVPPAVVRYMSERWREFRGISLETTWVRTYPQGDLAAHILGSTGKITAENLSQYRRKGYVGNETIGVGGLEQQYEEYLKGTPGKAVYEVDANGEPRAQAPLDTVQPLPGNDLQTSIDLKPQRALQDALERYSRLGSGKAAGVALDVNTGAVVSLASYPTFKPQIFVDRREKAIDRLMNDPKRAAVNRATSGLYPVGSTFKPITATAALRNGKLSTGETIDSVGRREFYEQEFQNFRYESHGPVALPRALEVSSDTYFYEIGDRFYRMGDSWPLQDEARRYGFGQPTGIDLPSESAGTVPDEQWLKRTFPPPRFGQIDRIWKPGYTIQLTVGQGFMEATPLQLAQSYLPLANGGTVHTPTIGRAIKEPSGRVLRRLNEAAGSRNLELQDDWLSSIRAGLELASNGVEGTGTAVFGPLPPEARVAGKTGTAETGKGGAEAPDHSWFVGFAPADDPKIVVAVIVENAGTGSNAAAPAVCATITTALNVPPSECGTAQASAN